MDKNNIDNLDQEQIIKKNLQEISKKPIENAFEDLDSSIDGLENKEAIKRLESFGPNEVIYEKRKPWYVYLLRSFLDPFILILLFIVFISYFTDIAFAPSEEKSYITILIISILITISVMLRFTQEYKSQITADNLKTLVPTTTSIERRG